MVHIKAHQQVGIFASCFKTKASFGQASCVDLQTGYQVPRLDVRLKTCFGFSQRKILFYLGRAGIVVRNVVVVVHHKVGSLGPALFADTLLTKLSSIPKEVANLTNLVRLRLMYSFTGDVPRDLALLTKLTRLEITGPDPSIPQEVLDLNIEEVLVQHS
jgi:hypothetical protein